MPSCCIKWSQLIGVCMGFQAHVFPSKVSNERDVVSNHQRRFGGTLPIPPFAMTLEPSAQEGLVEVDSGHMEVWGVIEPPKGLNDFVHRSNLA